MYCPYPCIVLVPVILILAIFLLIFHRSMGVNSGLSGLLDVQQSKQQVHRRALICTSKPGCGSNLMALTTHGVLPAAPVLQPFEITTAVHREMRITNTGLLERAVARINVWTFERSSHMGTEIPNGDPLWKNAEAGFLTLIARITFQLVLLSMLFLSTEKKKKKIEGLPILPDVDLPHFSQEEE